MTPQVIKRPLGVMTLLLVLGYLWRVPGTAHPDDYHAYSFKALNYSDIIALYLRDGLDGHPRPYLDVAFEYPVLIGALSYVLSYASSLSLYYGLAYGMLALGGLTTTIVLQKLPGAQVWYFAATPALVLYSGLNWDLIAIAATALALLAYSRERDVWGTLALVAAVWLKFFPIVFLAAVLIERGRQRRWRSALVILGVFGAFSVLLNAPVAMLNTDGWLYFFTFNSQRPPEPSIWSILPELSIAWVNSLSLLALAAIALPLCLLAWRSRKPVTLPLGAGLLLGWLFVNKIYSPQYALWVFFALALLGGSRILWQSYVAFDVGYYVVSFQMLYISTLNLPDLIDWQIRYLLHPLVVLRLFLLATLIASGAWVLWRFRSLPQATEPRVS